MKYIIIIILAFFIQSCISAEKKATSGSCIYIQPPLPYGALERRKQDTTFDYYILDRERISTKLPDSIAGRNVIGGAEFYVIIDENKKIKKIKLTDVSIYSKNKLIYSYFRNTNSDTSRKLASYLSSFIQRIDFKQTKIASAGFHPTYCFVGFHKNK